MATTTTAPAPATATIPTTATATSSPNKKVVKPSTSSSSKPSAAAAAAAAAAAKASRAKKASSRSSVSPTLILLGALACFGIAFLLLFWNPQEEQQQQQQQQQQQPKSAKEQQQASEQPGATRREKATTPQVAPPGTVVALTPENYESLTRNKNIFIKLYAPWCGHCQQLAPVWTELAAALVKEESNDRVLIAEIDCTESQPIEDWCSDHFRITGFPTLLYGDASMGGLFLESYGGERTLEALQLHVKAHLSKPLCTPGNLAACTHPDTRAQMAAMWDMSQAALDRQITELQAKADAAQATFAAEFQKLQEQFEKGEAQFLELEKIAKTEIGWMKSVRAKILQHEERQSKRVLAAAAEEQLQQQEEENRIQQEEQQQQQQQQQQQEPEL